MKSETWSGRGTLLKGNETVLQDVPYTITITTRSSGMRHIDGSVDGDFATLTALVMEEPPPRLVLQLDDGVRTRRAAPHSHRRPALDSAEAVSGSISGVSATLVRCVEVRRRGWPVDVERCPLACGDWARYSPHFVRHLFGVAANASYNHRRTCGEWQPISMSFLTGRSSAGMTDAWRPL
jgi:hypothetical protein